MSINLESGLWRCFKTKHTGNFLKLYSILERVTYSQAYENFLFDSLLREPIKEEVKAPKVIPEDLGLGPLEEVSQEAALKSRIQSLAWDFVKSRGMVDEKFYIAKEGPAKDRLVIPFFNEKGKMFFFQARALLSDAFPKYLNAKHFKSSNVLYTYDYGSYDPLFITEGVFDCLSLKKAGYNATTTLSCMVSNEQMRQLKHYQGPLVVAYDSDAAGQDGVEKFLKIARKHKIKDLYYTSPEGGKDWNELYTNGKLVDTVRINYLDDLALAIRKL